MEFGDLLRGAASTGGCYLIGYFAVSLSLTMSISGKIGEWTY